MTINTRSPGKAVFCVTERHVAYEDGGPLCFRFSRRHSPGVKSLAEGGDAGEIGAFPSEVAANVLKWQGLRDFGLSSSGGEEEAENLSATAGPSRPERPSLAPSPGGSPEPSPVTRCLSSSACSPTSDAVGRGGGCLRAASWPPALSFRTPGRKPCSFPPFSFRSANPEMQGGLAWWKGCGFGGRAVPIQALSRGTGQVTRGFSFLLCKMGMMCPRHRIAVRINGNELEVPGLAPGPRGWLRWTSAESGSAGVRRGPCSSCSLLNLEM